MFEKLLQQHKVQITQQRITLLKILKEFSRPVTIEEINNKTKNLMNKTTLYRSLEVLVSAGIIYQTDFREGVSYFEFQHDNHHHHMVCTRCKNKEFLDYCPKFPAAKIKTSHGFSITHHIFEIFGLCKKCTK